MSKTIYIVVFPPDVGGNHLSNLLLTSLKNTDINNSLYQYYNGKMVSDGIAHGEELTSQFFKINNCEVHYPDKLINYISKFEDYCIICGHIDEVYHVFDKIVDMGTIVFVNIEMDNLLVIGRENNKKRVDYWMYRFDVISKLFNVPVEAVVDMPVSLLWSNDVKQITTKLSNSYEFETITKRKLIFDDGLCAMMHSKWLGMVKETK
jgi:hypothetical protein